jgi:hypothetical protein
MWILERGALGYRPIDGRHNSLRLTYDLLIERRGQVQTRVLASLAETVISTRLAWGGGCAPVAYAISILIGTVWSFISCRVSLLEEAINELLFWQQFPRLKFETELCFFS